MSDQEIVEKMSQLVGLLNKVLNDAAVAGIEIEIGTSEITAMEHLAYCLVVQFRATKVLGGDLGA